jgi:hypothetical protein
MIINDIYNTIDKISDRNPKDLLPMTARAVKVPRITPIIIALCPCPGH